MEEQSVLHTWEWRRVLGKLLRVVRPGGVVRITKGEVIPESSSPAFLQHYEVLFRALFRSGYLFTQESTGVISYLVPMLDQHGFQQVQTKASTLRYRADTLEGQRSPLSGDVQTGSHVAGKRKEGAPGNA